MARVKPRVLVLRDERGDALVAALAARGMSVTRHSPIRYESVDWYPPERADWAVITSVATVRALHGRWPSVDNVAAVGPATARALASDGIPVALVPEVASGAGLAAAMPPGTGTNAWLPRSDLAGDELPDLLTSKGYRVTQQVVYRTIRCPLPRTIESALVSAAFGLVVVYSPSAVDVLPPGCSVPALAIGEPTTAALRRASLRVAATAARPSDDAVLDAVATIIGERKDES